MRRQGTLVVTALLALLIPVAGFAQPTLTCNGPVVGFESGAFPVDWSITTQALPGGQFLVSTDNSSAFWDPGPAPEGIYYASANDDAPGSGSDGSADFLYTNIIDLSSASDASLSFWYHFDATFGHSAGGVEVSGNGGSTWDGEIIVPSGTVWQTYNLDLTAYAGNPNVQVRFHSNDGGAWAAGYAVDAVGLTCTIVSYVPPVIQEIPTLGTLGLALLAALLAAGAFLLLRRNRTTPTA
jgi:hypothetical protein